MENGDRLKVYVVFKVCLKMR